VASEKSMVSGDVSPVWHSCSFRVRTNLKVVPGSHDEMNMSLRSYNFDKVNIRRVILR
jgi:hypothetical protein